MKKVIVIISMLILCMCCSCGNTNYVEQGTYGENIKWTLDDEGVLLINGKGQMLEYEQAKDIPWDKIRANIKSVIIKKGITNISSNAFSECGNLTSIDIPNSVINIGEEAFYMCKNLTYIKLHNEIESIGKSAFQGCQKIEQVNIPTKLEVIEKGTFSSYGLKEIVIPDGVVSIKERAIEGDNLLDVYIPKSVESMYENSFGVFPNIKNIYYSGSENEWKSIEIKDSMSGYASSGVLNLSKETKIHYNSKR